MRWVDQDAHATSQRLQGYLAQLARRLPDIWSQADEFRSRRGKDLPGWPGWCFLPFDLSLLLASRGGNVKDSEKPLWGDVVTVAALTSWRPTQGIYKFHPEVFSALWDTPLDGDIPVDLLYRLPEWCCYIDCYMKPHRDYTLAGFFVFLSFVGDGRCELCIVLNDTHNKMNQLRPYVLAVPGHATIAEMYQGFVDGLRATYRQEGIELPGNLARDQSLIAEECAKTLKPLMSLILYLCSTSREFRDLRGTDKLPARARPTKTKRGERIFAPDRPTIWETGYRIGRLIEQAKADRIYGKGTGEGAHASPEPHIRKQHWHHFWKGAKKDPRKRELIVHWLPPIPVGYKGEEIVPTIHPVK
jgi:hypothetical protein